MGEILCISRIRSNILCNHAAPTLNPELRKSATYTEDAAPLEETDSASAVDEQAPAEATADELNLEQLLEKLQLAEEAAEKANSGRR